MKKGSALALVLGGKPADEDEESDGGDLELAAQDLIDAMKAGDAMAVADAFRSMKELCEGEYEAEPEPEPSEE